MKNKKTVALLLGLVMTGTAFGAVSQIKSYAGDNVKLQIADMEDQLKDNQDSSAGDAYSSISTADLVDTSTGVQYSSVADIAENAMPSIVAITNKSVQEVQSYFRGQTFTRESESCGSGFIVGENDDELLICTNNHVIDGAAEIAVTFIDENSYTGHVKGTDPSNDLAIVAVNKSDISDDTMSQIKIAQIGNSDDMRVGEQVVAIGNAMGYGQSVTTGIVSAKDRTITLEDGFETTTYENLIQTDAAINPGNSGGALLNMEGAVIGINSAKASSAGVEGMGYAIPLSKAQPILEKLMSLETREIVDEEDAAYMGISGQAVTSDVMTLYGIPAGVCVTDVSADGPADKAGLQRGDIITEFDGIPVTNMEELKNRLQYYKGGETVDLTVQTADKGEYKDHTVTIELGLRSDYMNQQ